jgi:hypothetical protein
MRRKSWERRRTKNVIKAEDVVRVALDAGHAKWTAVLRYKNAPAPKHFRDDYVDQDGLGHREVFLKDCPVTMVPEQMIAWARAKWPNAEIEVLKDRFEAHHAKLRAAAKGANNG